MIDLGEKPFGCVSIACDTEGSLCSLLQKAAEQQAGMAEIRLDYLTDPSRIDLKALCRNAPLPLLFTNRASFEGGHFRGAEEERIALLINAIEAGAACVDVELATEQHLRSLVQTKARAHGCAFIVSHHDFTQTPDLNSLHRLLLEMEMTAADILKLITTAKNADDVKRLLSLYEWRYNRTNPPVEADKTIQNHLIAFCMGERGRMSRLCAMTLGAPFTYAALESGQETASGQLSVSEVGRFLDYW